MLISYNDGGVGSIFSEHSIFITNMQRFVFFPPVESEHSDVFSAMHVSASGPDASVDSPDIAMLSTNIPSGAHKPATICRIVASNSILCQKGKEGQRYICFYMVT